MGVDVVGVSRWLEIVVVVDDGVGVLSYSEIVPCVGVVVDGGVGVDVVRVAGTGFVDVVIVVVVDDVVGV